jgi:hypothetical protein
MHPQLRRVDGALDRQFYLDQSYFLMVQLHRRLMCQDDMAKIHRDVHQRRRVHRYLDAPVGEQQNLDELRLDVNPPSVGARRDAKIVVLVGEEPRYR